MNDKPAAPSAAGIVASVLGYMDAPWKVVAIVVLLVVCGIGYVLYTERARIADAVLHEPSFRPVLALEPFINGGAELLLRETKGDLAVLAELNLNDNISVDRIGIDRNGVRWVPIEGPQPALYPGSSMQKVITFLQNDVVCANTDEGANEDFHAMYVAGFVRACIVAVPPILGVTVGALVVAWKTAPLAAAEQRAGIALTKAAMTFAKW